MGKCLGGGKIGQMKWQRQSLQTARKKEYRSVSLCMCRCVCVSMCVLEWVGVHTSAYAYAVGKKEGVCSLGDSRDGLLGNHSF